MNVSVVISMFVEGLVSFFSPCIIPVLPLYLGYLASGAKSKDENGNVVYNRLKVFVTTCFFVLGISFAILLLGVSVSVFNNVFSDYSLIISFVGSFLLIIFGLYTLGVIRVPLFERERRIGVNLSLNRLSYIQALAWFFVFFFLDTLCWPISDQCSDNGFGSGFSIKWRYLYFYLYSWFCDTFSSAWSVC